MSAQIYDTGEKQIVTDLIVEAGETPDTDTATLQLKFSLHGLNLNKNNLGIIHDSSELSNKKIFLRLCLC